MVCISHECAAFFSYEKQTMNGKIFFLEEKA
jgi:hypothetical protein